MPWGRPAHRRRHTFDALLELGPEQSFNAAGDDILQRDGADGVAFLGTGLVDGMWSTYVSALDIAGDDELYRLILLGSELEDLSGDVAALNILELGPAASLVGNVDLGVGHYDVPFSNQLGNVVYPYMFMRTVRSGVSTLITLRSELAKLPPLTTAL